MKYKKFLESTHEPAEDMLQIHIPFELIPDYIEFNILLDDYQLHAYKNNQDNMFIISYSKSNNIKDFLIVLDIDAESYYPELFD